MATHVKPTLVVNTYVRTEEMDTNVFVCTVTLVPTAKYLQITAHPTIANTELLV